MSPPFERVPSRFSRQGTLARRSPLGFTTRRRRKPLVTKTREREYAVAERALPENSTTDEDESLDDEQGEQAGGGGQTPPNWALRGALIGAVAGSVTGAGLGMLLARRPEALAQAREAIGESGGHVARAAAAAAGEVVTSRQLNQLLQGEGNGDRGEMMKEAAR